MNKEFEKYSPNLYRKITSGTLIDPRAENIQLELKEVNLVELAQDLWFRLFISIGFLLMSLLFIFDEVEIQGDTSKIIYIIIGVIIILSALIILFDSIKKINNPSYRSYLKINKNRIEHYTDDKKLELYDWNEIQDAAIKLYHGNNDGPEYYLLLKTKEELISIDFTYLKIVNANEFEEVNKSQFTQSKELKVKLIMAWLNKKLIQIDN